MFFPQCERRNFNPYKTCKITYVLIFRFYDRKEEDFEINGSNQSLYLISLPPSPSQKKREERR
jgi:hypothetical protein